ncbi:MAG: hypothetical protein QM757_06075 [Paludibaculum sp.]
MAQWRRTAEAARQTPECRDLPLDQEPYKTVLAMAGSFDGIPRHFAMHPCGLVISGDRITERIPLFESAKGLMTTHYAMDDVEELGLLKLDLLGQAGLTVLHDTLVNLEENGQPKPDLERLDWTDGETWEAIATGKARGVFHIESPAMTNLLVMTDCRDIDCLTAVESIIRPGAANERKEKGLCPPSPGAGAGDLCPPLAGKSAAGHLRPDGVRGAYPVGGKRLCRHAMGPGRPVAASPGEEQRPRTHRVAGPGVSRGRPGPGPHGRGDR